MNIQGEVEAHLRLLDQMVRSLLAGQPRLTPFQGLDMEHTRGAISGTMDRFKRVLEHKGNRHLAYVIGGVAFLFVLVHYLG